jgi:hypothetical protein
LREERDERDRQLKMLEAEMGAEEPPSKKPRMDDSIIIEPAIDLQREEAHWAALVSKEPQDDADVTERMLTALLKAVNTPTELIDRLKKGGCLSSVESIAAANTKLLSGEARTWITMIKTMLNKHESAAGTGVMTKLAPVLAETARAKFQRICPTHSRRVCWEKVGIFASLLMESRVPTIMAESDITAVFASEREEPREAVFILLKLMEALDVINAVESNILHTRLAELTGAYQARAVGLCKCISHFLRRKPETRGILHEQMDARWADETVQATVSFVAEKTQRNDHRDRQADARGWTSNTHKHGGKGGKGGKGANHRGNNSSSSSSWGNSRGSGSSCNSNHGSSSSSGWKKNSSSSSSWAGWGSNDDCSGRKKKGKGIRWTNAEWIACYQAQKDEEDKQKAAAQ